MEAKRDQILYEMYVENPSKKAEIPQAEMMHELTRIKLAQKEREKRDQRIHEREALKAKEKGAYNRL